jgi:nicotinamide mononucleotide transporter
MDASTALYIEIVAVLLGLTYLFLMIRENIWCWSFGIVSSLLSILLFLDAKLYSESILYFFYVIVGLYGWYTWGIKGKTNPFGQKKNNEILDNDNIEDTEENKLKISTWNAQKHIIALVLGFSLSALVGYLFDKNTDANNPYIDAHTSIFGLVASYMEAHKILTGWLFWIVLNALSIWLYWTRGLEVYAGLMVVYFIISFAGFYEWRKRFNAQQI